MNLTKDQVNQIWFRVLNPDGCWHRLEMLELGPYSACMAYCFCCEEKGSALHIDGDFIATSNGITNPDYHTPEGFFYAIRYLFNTHEPLVRKWLSEVLKDKKDDETFEYADPFDIIDWFLDYEYTLEIFIQWAIENNMPEFIKAHEEIINKPT
jgi:hypothetical protein